jgi:hypothetical protein
MTRTAPFALVGKNSNNYQQDGRSKYYNVTTFLPDPFLESFLVFEENTFFLTCSESAFFFSIESLVARAAANFASSAL